MHKYLLAAALFASTLSVQTTVVAQPTSDEGSRTYCEARWARMVSFGTTRGDTEASFVDKCMSCNAKFRDMMSSGQGNQVNQDAYLRECSKAAYWGYGYNGIPEYALLLVGAAALGAGIGIGYAIHPSSPVSP